LTNFYVLANVFFSLGEVVCQLFHLVNFIFTRQSYLAILIFFFSYFIL
jgi:hypothetical protein